jgi:hypothetical protein
MEKISGGLRGLVLFAAILFIALYLFVALSRINYPFELEWLEGGMVDHVRWNLNGHKLYLAPSLDFISYLYNPLYVYVSVLFTLILGEGFFPLRLISLLSSIGSIILIYKIVRRETGDFFSALLAAGLFAATFKVSGYWWDIGRNDSLFFFLLLCAVYLLRFRNSITSNIIAAVFVVLSFLTKQTTLLIFIPLLLYVLLYKHRYSRYFLGTSILGIGLMILVLNVIHDGWYIYYCFELQLTQQILKKRFITFWAKDLFSTVGIAFLISTIFLAYQFIHSKKDVFAFYFLLVTGLVGGSWASRIHPGNYENVLIPAFAVVSLIFGLAIFQGIKKLRTRKRRSHYLEVCLYLLCLMQFGRLAYNPVQQIPTKEDRKAGEHLVQTIGEIEGEVFIPCHGYLATKSGKDSYAHLMAIQDVVAGRDETTKSLLLRELEQAIRTKKFNAIILDADLSKCQRDKNLGILFTDVFKNYEIKKAIFTDRRVFWPVSGMQTRPENIYVSKNAEGL